jgi:glycosyltransferase involved in cell wall biosynthesis
VRVFLLAPEFRTLGGMEGQLAALAAGLQGQGAQASVFIRLPVRADHPYWRQMAAAGVELDCPVAWLARLLAPPAWLRQAVLNSLIALAAPALALLALADAPLRRRPWRRSWQGATGRLRGWLGPLVEFDGLTWRLERQMDRAAQRKRPDVLDVQHSMLPQGIVYGRRRGLPTVYTEYGAPSEELWPVWAGLCPVINQADFIIGRSQASLDGLRRLCGADRPAAIVPNTVADLPAPDEAEPGEPGEAGGVVITALGRLAAEKGPQHLLAAFGLLAAEGLPVRLVLAGEGPLRESLQAEARASGLGDRVAFTGAFVSAGAVLRAAHIVAHPTLNDGRSVSVLEAMAWGRPVVASRTGGLPELIEDGVSGLLVPPADPRALAGALRTLTLDAERRRRMGQAARRRFLEGRYSQADMVRQTLAIYRQVAARPAG